MVTPTGIARVDTPTTTASTRRGLCRNEPLDPLIVVVPRPIAERLPHNPAGRVSGVTRSLFPLRIAVRSRRRRRARDAVRIGLLEIPVLEQLLDPVVVLHVAGVDAVGEAADLELEIGALEVAAAGGDKREVHARYRVGDLGARLDLP